ncbi:ROBO3 [Mactra antiquata]
MSSLSELRFTIRLESYGAAVVSVNTLGEHNFIVQQLTVYNAIGEYWYTSGIAGVMLFFSEYWYTSGIAGVIGNGLAWDGDGTHVIPGNEWWFSDQDKNLSFPRIIYKTDGARYGWSRVSSTTILPFICEIPIVEAYRISQDERDFSTYCILISLECYGTNMTDPNSAPRGPTFIVQPRNLVVVEEDARNDVDDEYFTVSLECLADGKPSPTYRITHTYNNGTRVEVTPALDDRYTISGGRLTILGPKESLDTGIYQCIATNQYGTSYSNVANLTFGVLEEFSNVQRAPVVAEEYQSTVIECSPPNYKPAVSYQWYRGLNADFVRPDLNPYIFISSNGKLYFSEVTQNDEADYYCIVKLTSNGEEMSTYQPPSRISTPIPLEVRHQVPATWGPVIADGFIASFPNKPLRGRTVKLECLAYGTLPLTYSWSREQFPMPSSAVFSDSNRILEIYDLQLEDAGIYVCNVARDTGAQTHAIYNLAVESSPYFLFPLPHQHANIGSPLTWRCVAKSVPSGVYMWLKNGEHILSIPGDIEINRNVLTIQSVDEARHAGMYQCVALNTHGYTYSTAQLRVLGFKPTFAKDPLDSSQSAAIGSHTTIACSPEAAPTPEYTWTRNGINLNTPPDDGTSRVRLLPNGDLYIDVIQSSDAGRYCCTATNSYGSDISCGQLNVVPSTVIRTSPVNTVGKINMTSVLLCDASFPGTADSVYVWRFNGRDINLDNHQHYRMGSAQYPGALYVISAHYDQSGVYTCVAKTTYDTVNVSATLTVEGPPGAPAGVTVDTSTITPTSAVVIWTEGEQHGQPVQYHIVEACTEYNKTYIPISPYIPVPESQYPGLKKHKYEVTNLKSGNGYFFRVRAVNALGVGLASRSSSMFKIPGSVPWKYPDNVGGGGGSVGILTITWDPLPQDEQGGPGIGYVVYWRLANATNKYREEIVTENIGMFATTVGSDNFYLLYEVKVGVFNDFGAGPTSPDGVLIYSAEDIPNTIVRGVYAFPYNSTAIEVQWDLVTDNRQNMRGKLLGYQVNYILRFVEGASYEALSWRGESDSGIIIGLDPYTWYTVDVIVLNTAGMGPMGEVYHARTYKLPPILYPVEIKVYSHSAHSVRITWRGVSSTTEEENIEGYKVRYWVTTDDVRTAIDVVTGRTETEAIVHGIQKDTVYECRVLGYSRGGDGKHSQSVYFTLGGMLIFDPSSSEVLAAASSIQSTLYIIILSFISFILIYRDI